MEITGKIIRVLPERSGTSARGEWKAQSFVIETRDQYPRKMVFDVFGAERLQRFNIKSGDEVTVFSAEPGNDLETMARVLDTIPYEIMTSVSSRVKRIYLKE